MVEGEGGGSQNPSQPLGIFFFSGEEEGGRGQDYLTEISMYFQYIPSVKISKCNSSSCTYIAIILTFTYA